MTVADEAGQRWSAAVRSLQHPQVVERSRSIPVDALGELAAFSAAIESWHNTAHGAIGSATGTPMMDARQNVFFRPFWKFQVLIDDLFEVVLRQYGDRAHRDQFVTAAAVAAHIEARHHGWVPRI